MASGRGRLREEVPAYLSVLHLQDCELLGCDARQFGVRIIHGGHFDLGRGKNAKIAY